MFTPFGSAHVVTLAVTVLVPLLLAWLVRGRPAAVRSVGYGFVALLLASKAVYVGLTIHYGATGAVLLHALIPMQLCDWGAIAAIVTFLRPNRLSFELTYFWGLGGTLQAMLTPDLADGFPSLSFLSFFGYHGGIIGAVIFMVAGMGLRPVPLSVLRAAAISLLYIPVAMAVNWLLGTNFGYLAAKPANPSLLDHLGPWPWYILAMAAVGIASLAVYYAPFLARDLIAGRRQAPHRG